MGKIIRYRGLFLGGAVSLLLLPTYFVLAAPITAQDVKFDISWMKELPPIMAVLFIMAFTFYLTTRILSNQQNKVQIQTPEGQTKSASLAEIVGLAFNRMVDFMKESQAGNERRDQQFQEFINGIIKDLNNHTDQTNSTLVQFRDELIEGRGNQLTAIMEVRDTITERLTTTVNGMRESRADLKTDMGEIRGGVNSIQTGQGKMQEDLRILLLETKRLAQVVEQIQKNLTQVGENVGLANTTVNSVKQQLSQGLTELRGVVEEMGKRLDQMNKPLPPELKPDVILIEQPKIDPLTKPDQEQKEGTNERSPE